MLRTLLMLALALNASAKTQLSIARHEEPPVTLMVSSHIHHTVCVIRYIVYQVVVAVAENPDTLEAL